MRLPSPVVARLPEDLAPEVWNFEVELKALGFCFEPFGDGAVSALGRARDRTDPEAAFLAALYALAGGEDLARALACKGSTKFAGRACRRRSQGLAKGMVSDGVQRSLPSREAHSEAFEACGSTQGVADSRAPVGVVDGPPHGS